MAFKPLVPLRSLKPIKPLKSNFNFDKLYNQYQSRLEEVRRQKGAVVDKPEPKKEKTDYGLIDPAKSMKENTRAITKFGPVPNSQHLKYGFDN